MDNVYREAFAEVLEVIKNSNQRILEKIPKKFITFLNENKDNNYIVKIDFTDENWDDSIKQETQAILALIYRDYIVSQEERARLLTEEKEEQIRIENELREKYNPDNLFKKQDQAKKAEEVMTEDVAMVEYKESIFKRFINKIKSIFKMTKRNL